MSRDAVRAEFERLMADHLAGQLSSDDGVRLRALLEACPERAAELAGLQEVECMLRNFSLVERFPAESDDATLLMTQIQERLSVDRDLLGKIDARLSRVTGKRRTTVRPPLRSRAVEMRGRGLVGRSWLPTAIAAALLVGVGVLVSRQFGLIGPRMSDSAIVASRLAGRVDWVRNGRAQPLAGDVRVEAGDRLATAGGDGAARLRYADGTTLELGAATGVRLTGGQAIVFIERGRVVASVARRPADDPFVLETPHAAVQVLGTLFTVEVDAGATRIEMQRGVVRITNKATRETADLRAGYHAVVGARTVVAATPRLQAGPDRRVTSGLLVLYTFREGRGPFVHDVSGVGEPLDLTIRSMAGLRWLPGGGIVVRQPASISSGKPAVKITEACRRSNEFSAEVWVAPADTVQGSINYQWIVRLLTVSRDAGNRNFTLGQWGGDYRGRVRTTETCPNGTPDLYSRHGCATTDLTHVVYTREASGRVRMFVNGVDCSAGRRTYEPVREEVPGTPVVIPGTFANWDERYALTLCNEWQREEGLPRGWLGRMYLAAVYGRALSPEEVARNYRAGVGPMSVSRSP
ncbi:MAG: FecR domain-containing protein [Kiritimatiellae bacterium]|nr:FecR domain-containing protein [Kiritimatiellia bacterium]